jgi:membrane-associated phospholipid phosphatase
VKSTLLFLIGLAIFFSPLPAWADDKLELFVEEPDSQRSLAALADPLVRPSLRPEYTTWYVTDEPERSLAPNSCGETRAEQSFFHSWRGFRDTGLFCDHLWQDTKHQYSPETLGYLAVGIAVAAPIANTHADKGFRDWYQHHVRSDGLNKVGDAVYTLGDYRITIPVIVGAGVGSWWVEDRWPQGGVIGEWSSRTVRAVCVGGTTVGILQYTLGSYRPDDEHDSHWRPFTSNHGVSGHAFIGAVPFLSAAEMTDNPWLRTGLFAASAAVGWSRINDDGHYLSQAILGWWIAYLATRSVDQTYREERRIQAVPWFQEDASGVGVLIRY